MRLKLFWKIWMTVWCVRMMKERPFRIGKKEIDLATFDVNFFLFMNTYYLT